MKIFSINKRNSILDYYGWRDPTDENNLEWRINNVIETIENRYRGYPTPNFLFLLGCDFTYRYPSAKQLFDWLTPVMGNYINYINSL